MKFGKKLDKILWWIIYTFPIWLILFTAISNMGNTTGMTFETISEGISGLLPTTGTLFETISSVMEYIVPANTGLIKVLCQFITYLIGAHFIHIIELIMVFFIHITEKLIDKAKGRADE